MKIDKEKFNSLKQLDRIEYLSKKSILDISMYANSTQYFLLAFFGLIILYIGDTSWRIISVGILSVVVGLFITYLFLFKYMKSMKNLEEEYFSVEVKK